MYQEPSYIFREETGQATVCLVKDLETVEAVPVDSVTVQDTAIGKLCDT